MRIFLVLTIFSLFSLLSSCSVWTRSPSSVSSAFPRTRHVVFDIDWTITSEVKPDSSGKRIIEVEGKKYFVHDGVEEFVEELLKHDNIKISFFSGGSLSRNHALLDKIKLKNGKSLKSVAYKILNREDLTIMANALPTDKFSTRFKKDLSKISKDLDELIMFDDTEHFVLNQKQEDHVLYLGKTFEHFETFKEATLSTGDYVPKTESEWSFARKKLTILNGAVSMALKESDETGISFSEAMKLQANELDLGSSEWNDYSNKMYKISLALNARALSRPGPISCLRLISPFLTE